MRKLTVITAGLSTPSTTRHIADQIAAATQTAVSARGEEAEVTVLELKDYATELAQFMVTGGVPTPLIDDLRNTIHNSDGLIAVTPVFKASYSGLFKLFFDVLENTALIDMPVIVAATAGSIRHALVLDYAMRPLFSYLRANVMPTGIFAATEDFGGEAGQLLTERISRAAGELAEYMVTQRDSVGGLGGVTARGAIQRRTSGTDAMEEFTPFSELLQGHDGSASS